MSLRNNIVQEVERVLKEIEEPRIALITREPFEVSELAITQFPALLLTFAEETRETITMGQQSFGRRQGTIVVNIRAFVRGTELDRRRNEIIEAIEEQLEHDRNLNLKAQGVQDSQIINIEVINRLQPLAEVSINLQVRYNYLRGAT
jgi:hypothetical protein